MLISIILTYDFLEAMILELIDTITKKMMMMMMMMMMTMMIVVIMIVMCYSPCLQHCVVKLVAVVRISSSNMATSPSIDLVMQYRLYGDDGINESITSVNDRDDDTIALFPWTLIAGILTSVSFAKMPQLTIPCSVILPLTVTFCLPGVTTS